MTDDLAVDDRKNLQSMDVTGERKGKEIAGYVSKVWRVPVNQMLREVRRLTVYSRIKLWVQPRVS